MQITYHPICLGMINYTAILFQLTSKVLPVAFGKGDLNEDCFSKQRDVFIIPARNKGAPDLLIKIKNKW